MVETLLPQLEDPEAREAVADAVLALLARWGLHEINQSRLLGLSSVIEIKQKLLAGDSDTIKRAAYLLAIGRALLHRYPSQTQKQDGWIFMGNEHLGGLSPLSIMLKKGIPGIIVIKRLAESEG